MTREAAPRLVSLDVLRALAVVLVLGRHFPGGLQSTGNGFVDTFLAGWQTGGWVGVDLFFVLSGYLISGLLFREQARHGRIDLKRFLIRRGLRIYPPFYVFIAVTLLLAAWAGVDTPTAAILGELFYLQNYVGSLWPHTWSLAVEEHFYVGLPLALILLRRPGRNPFVWIPALCLLLALGCLGLRFASSVASEALLIPTHLRVDSLAFGVLISYVHHFQPARLACGGWTRAALALTGVVLLAPAFLLPLATHRLVGTLGLSLFYLGSGALLVSSLGLQLSGRAWRWLGLVGAHSYSIYLWHFPARRLVGLLPQWSGYELPTGVWLLTYLTLSLATGILLSKLIELPVLRLRDRWFPTRSGLLPGQVDPAASSAGKVSPAEGAP